MLVVDAFELKLVVRVSDVPFLAPIAAILVVANQMYFVVVK